MESWYYVLHACTKMENHRYDMYASQLQAKLDFTEQELLSAKDKENTMAVELGRVESEVSLACVAR